MRLQLAQGVVAKVQILETIRLRLECGARDGGDVVVVQREALQLAQPLEDAAFERGEARVGDLEIFQLAHSVQHPRREVGDATLVDVQDLEAGQVLDGGRKAGQPRVVDVKLHQRGGHLLAESAVTYVLIY